MILDASFNFQLSPKTGRISVGNPDHDKVLDIIAMHKATFNGDTLVLNPALSSDIVMVASAFLNARGSNTKGSQVLIENKTPPTPDSLIAAINAIDSRNLWFGALIEQYIQAAVFGKDDPRFTPEQVSEDTLIHAIEMYNSLISVSPVLGKQPHYFGSWHVAATITMHLLNGLSQSAKRASMHPAVIATYKAMSENLHSHVTASDISVIFSSTVVDLGTLRTMGVLKGNGKTTSNTRTFFQNMLEGCVPASTDNYSSEMVESYTSMLEASCKPRKSS